MILTQKKKQKLVVQALKNVGMMVARGVPLPCALEYAVRTAAAVLPRRRLYALENILPSAAFFLEKALLGSSKDIVEGLKLSKAIARRAALSGETADAIAKGEANGTLPQALMALDGNEMVEGCGMAITDAAIVKMVNGILKPAMILGADSIAFPSLPDGQVVAPLESSGGSAEGPSTMTGDPDIDGMDDHVSVALDQLFFMDDDPEDKLAWRVHYRIEGKWVAFLGFPGVCLGAVMRRTLVMAGIPYWGKEPQEGSFRLRTGNRMSEFRLRYDPVEPRIHINLLPAP